MTASPAKSHATCSFATLMSESRKSFLCIVCQLNLSSTMVVVQREKVYLSPLAHYEERESHEGSEDSRWTRQRGTDNFEAKGTPFDKAAAMKNLRS